MNGEMTEILYHPDRVTIKYHGWENDFKSGSELEKKYSGNPFTYQ